MRAGEKPMMNPEMIAVSRIAVPLYESNKKRKNAGSGVGMGTTGGILCTRLCSPPMSNRGEKILSRNAFTGAIPQVTRMMHRRISGSHACHTSTVVAFTSSGVCGAMVECEGSAERSAADVQMVFGCQT